MWEALRVNRRAAAVLLVASAIWVAWVNLALARWTGPWLAGALSGAGVASCAASVLWLTVIWTSAVSSFSGADGEQATGRELARVARRGEWLVVNDIHFPRQGNIDHAAVGPGGVIVFETKWISPAQDEERFETERLRSAAAQASAEARNLRLRLLAAPYGVRVTTVVPVVVVWGGWVGRADVTEVNGVAVVRGAALHDWLAQFSGAPLRVNERTVIESALVAFADQTELDRVAELSTPLLVERGMSLVSEAAMLSVLGFAAIMLGAARLPSSTLWAALVFYLAALGVLGVLPRLRHRRFTHARLRVASMVWAWCGAGLLGLVAVLVLREVVVV